MMKMAREEEEGREERGREGRRGEEREALKVIFSDENDEFAGCE